MSFTIRVRAVLSALGLWMLVGVAAATPLNSVVTGGGSFNLNPGTTYQGGIFVTSNTIIEGNGAIIDLALGSGLPRNIGVNTSVSLTLRNVTLRNGDGVLTQPGAFFTGEGITFQNCMRALFTNSGASTNLSSCTISGHTVDAIGVYGGTTVLTNVSITGGQGVLVQNAGVLVWNGGGATSVLTAVNVLASGAQVNLSNLTFTACREALIAQGFQRVDVANCQVVNHQATTNAFQFSNSAGVVTMNNVSIAGQGLSQQGEGVLLQNLSVTAEPVQINNVTVHHMRGGVVAVTVANLSMSGCRLYQNHKNQLNIQYVGNALVQNTYLRGWPVRGTINVEDFDTLFVRASTMTVRDCVILDSPDTGILAYESNVTLVGTFIAGPRTFCIAAERDEEQNRFVGSTLLAVDCTFINSQLQNVFIGPQSTGTVLRCLIGYTTNRQSFPSTPSQPVAEPPFEGTGFHSTTAQFTLLQSLIYQPVQFGIQVNSFTSSALTGQGQVRWCTVAGVPGVTREGVIYVDAGSQQEFRDNHVFGINGTNRRGVLTDRVVTLTSMANSWLGNPGDIGLLQNGLASVNASSCYFGHPSGPSGLYGGSGSQVVGNASRINVSGHLTSPPLASVVGTMAVNGAGLGTATLDTGRVRVAMTYEAEAFTRPDDSQTAGFTGIIGLTDYRIPASAPNIDTAPTVPNEVRRVANLWIDRRLALLPQAVVPRLTLDISMPDLANPIQSARIAWVADGVLRSQNASQLSGFPTVARFVFDGAANFPTSTISLSFVEGQLVVPEPPASITYPPSSSASSGTISWATVAGIPPGGYQLERSANFGTSWTLIYDGLNDNFLDARGNGVYRYRVRSYNSIGFSNWRTGTIDQVVSISPEVAYTLTVNVAPGASAGSVTATPEPGPGGYEPGTVVTLFAFPAVDYQLAYWAGDIAPSAQQSVDVVMDRSRTVTANFSKAGASVFEQFPVAARAVPAAGGTVGVSPAPVITNQHRAGTMLSLSATPTAGYVFRQWAGDVQSTLTPASLVVNGAKQVIAAFALPPTGSRDALEPNDTQADAQPLLLTVPGLTTITGLRIENAGVPDWYRIQLPPRTHLTVDLVFEHNQGDLQLDLWDRRGVENPGSFGLSVGFSYSSSSVRSFETVNYVNITNPTELLMRVYGEGAATNPAYTLLLNTIELDDAYDINNIENNTACSSTIPTLVLGQRYDDLVCRDDDYYRFVIPPGITQLDVVVEHPFFSGDLHVMVIANADGDCAGAFGRIIGGGFSSDPVATSESLLSVNVAGQNSVWVRVYGANLFMRNIYALTVTGRP